MRTTSIDRSKIAIGVKSDSDLARWLDVAQSVVAGYKRRNTVPLEQCIKIAEKTGVSLDWLILGRGEQNAAQPQTTTHKSKLDSDETMLLTGWQYLDNDQRDAVFDLIRRLARGENTIKAVQQVINIHANVGQANAGNGNIENLTFSK